MFTWESPGVIIDASLFVPIHLLSDEVWPILALKISRLANSKLYPTQRGDAFNYQQKGGATMSKFDAAKQRFDSSPPRSGAFSQRFHATQAMFDDLRTFAPRLAVLSPNFLTPISDGARAAMVSGAFTRDFVPVLVWRSTAVRTPVQFKTS